ncbi:hypothetical protein [Streptomyces sp. NPDC002491]
MDAGLAAVLGALAGAIGTSLAGFATSWASREQAKITARAEHHRHRREPREAAYRAFITASNDLANHMGPTYGLPESATFPVPPPSREFTNEGRRLAALVKACWQDIALLGPPSVAEAATKTEAQAFQLASQCFLHSSSNAFNLSSEETARTGARARDRYSELRRQIIEFTNAARHALDDDGTS